MTITSITFSDNFSTWKDRFNQVVSQVNTLSSTNVTVSTNTISSEANTYGPPVDINLPSEEILLANTEFVPINVILSNGNSIGQTKTIFVENTPNVTTLILDKNSNSNLQIPLNANTLYVGADMFVKIIWNGSKWLLESYDGTIS